jgi:hypothetical protein
MKQKLNTVREALDRINGRKCNCYPLCASLQEIATPALSVLDEVVAMLDSPELVDKVVLAISEFHSGSITEGKRISEAAINTIKDSVNVDKN